MSAHDRHNMAVVKVSNIPSRSDADIRLAYPPARMLRALPRDVEVKVGMDSRWASFSAAGVDYRLETSESSRWPETDILMRSWTTEVEADATLLNEAVESCMRVSGAKALTTHEVVLEIKNGCMPMPL